MAREDLEARVTKLENNLSRDEDELVKFESIESRLILRTSELETRVTSLERWNKILTGMVTGIMSGLVVASIAYWIQGDASPWGLMAMLGFFVAVVLTNLYFRWVAPE